MFNPLRKVRANFDETLNAVHTTTIANMEMDICTIKKMLAQSLGCDSFTGEPVSQTAEHLRAGLLPASQPIHRVASCRIAPTVCIRLPSCVKPVFLLRHRKTNRGRRCKRRWCKHCGSHCMRQTNLAVLSAVSIKAVAQATCDRLREAPKTPEN